MQYTTDIRYISQDFFFLFCPAV